MGGKGVRLDRYLVGAGLVESEARARGLILAGKVFVAGVRVDKAGFPVRGTPAVEVRDRTARFVSRAGEKLDHALTVFGVDPAGLACLDVGISTGGFTDCLLQRGAAAVTGVDVGYGQVAHKVRSDPRVTVRERTNFRLLAAADFDRPFDLFVMDVSFISAGRLLPVVAQVLAPAGAGIVLVKPQFEAERGGVGEGGVVRDPAVHAAVLEKFRADCYHSGFTVAGIEASPLPGRDGNLEFLAFVRRSPEPAGPAPLDRLEPHDLERFDRG